jgi:hypothetical protein
MKALITTIREIKDFEKLWDVVTSIFKINHRLPDQVFSPSYRNFLFEEIDWAMSADFWDSFIRPLALASQDTHLLVAVLDPEPINYFYREFGYYGWRKLAVDIGGGDYFKLLGVGPASSPADAMLFDSETVVWVPTSKQWAIWGERSSGACILAFADEKTKLAKTPLLKTWRSADKALDDFIDLNFKDKKIPKEFADSLRQNYSESKFNLTTKKHNEPQKSDY